MNIYFSTGGRNSYAPTLPCTSSSSSVRSMTEPLGRTPGVAVLAGVDPVAWLSEADHKQKTISRNSLAKAMTNLVSLSMIQQLQRQQPCQVQHPHLSLKS